MGHHPRSQNHGSYGREDCWTEEATSALIEVWGDRFLELNRGNLRQKDWKDVSTAVNQHLAAIGKPRKTDIQCKNRIDTLKKKFKIEKIKSGPPTWRFYTRLEELLGDSAGKKARELSFTIKVRSPRNDSEGSISKSKVSSESSKEEFTRGNNRGRKVFLESRRQWGSFSEIDRLIGGANGRGKIGIDGAFEDLADAIERFGEIYERVEDSKQQQMVEVERRRIEIAKELEFQRMQLVKEARLKLEKIKRPEYSSSSGTVDPFLISQHQHSEFFV